MQFLRKIIQVFLCTISEVRAKFHGDQPLWGRDLKGGLPRAPPPPPSIIMERNSSVQLGLNNFGSKFKQDEFYDLIVMGPVA